MNPFGTLVRRAEREWTRTRNRLAVFPAIAARLLTEFEYGLDQDALDRWLARWLRDSRRLPEQVSLHNTFGQPPITLFNNGSLVVDLYFWVAADTTTHSHGFRGGFRVLHGNSLQETFRVQATRRIAPGVMQFDPGVPQMAILEQGGVHAILPGEQFVHRVIHLEKPTVTLCVKTINEPGIRQWEYHPDGLALERVDLAPDLTKEIYYFEYLRKRKPTMAARYLREVVGAQSVLMRMILVEALCGGDLALPEEGIDQCLAEVRRHHGKADWFKRHVDPDPLFLKELQFAGCDTALERLVAHFINRGYARATVDPLLSRLAGRALHRRDLEQVVLSLLDGEYVLGCSLSPGDRSAIKEVALEPKEKLPHHLESFGQIRRIRKFLRMFDQRPQSRRAAEQK